MRGVLTIPAWTLLLGLYGPAGRAQVRDGGGAPPAARLAAVPADVARQVREILRNQDGAADEVQVARLVALGEPAVPPLFALAVSASAAESAPDGQRLAIAALKEL